jgi:hypothetical protein
MVLLWRTMLCSWQTFPWGRMIFPLRTNFLQTRNMGENLYHNLVQCDNTVTRVWTLCHLLAIVKYSKIHLMCHLSGSAGTSLKEFWSMWCWLVVRNMKFSAYMWGCTNTVQQFAGATTLCIMVPNACGSSVWYFLTYLAPSILRYLLHFSKISVPLHINVSRIRFSSPRIWFLSLSVLECSWNFKDSCMWMVTKVRKDMYYLHTDISQEMKKFLLCLKVAELTF